MKNLIYIVCLLLCYFVVSAQEKKVEMEEEKLALRFFMDSIYPFRPILKDKILYSDGKIWQGVYSRFVYLTPYYKDMMKFFNNYYDYRDKHGIVVIMNDLKGRFKLKKWKIRRKKKDCYLYPKRLFKGNKRPRFPPSGFLSIESMYYDSTRREKLVAVRIIVNGFSQNYGWANYGFVIRDKQIVYWRKREGWKKR